MVRYVRNVAGFEQARKLRGEGLSYSEINRKLGFSKSTLSYWFSKDNGQRSLVKSSSENNLANKDRVRRMNQAKLQIKLSRHLQYRQQATAEYETFKNDPLFISGVSIYWGEGNKIESKGIVSVINTDAEMIRVMTGFYRKFLKVSEDKIRGQLFIYSDINHSQAISHWSSVSGIPKGQFIKTQIIPSRSKHSKRKCINGICSVYFSSTQSSIKMLEWVKILASNLRV